MSRILVDLPDSQIKELAAIVAFERRPRAAVIREAVEGYIRQRGRAPGADVFGLWKRREIAGLASQQELRSEW